MAQRFKLYYRLNEACEWQTSYAEGANLNDAKVALLLAVKTIYRIGSKGIEIVESFTDTPYPPKENALTPAPIQAMWPNHEYTDYY